MKFKQKQPVVQTAINNALSGGGGGGGGTTDYTELENKPQINSVTLSGNKTTSDLGIDEVPEVTSEDNGKILKATYSEGEGSYAWESAGGFTQVQANWNESDTTDPSYIQNKPTIPAAQVNSDWTANSGVAQILNKPDLSDMATKTWVGQQGYLTDADEVPQVTSSDDGKVLTASYNSGTGTGSYNWVTPATPSVDEVPAVTSADDGKVLTASYAGGTGSYDWASLGISFGPDYIEFSSGIRFYVTDQMPYDPDIPDGSYGIGW